MASFGDYNRVNTNVTAMDAQLSLNKINRDLGDSRLRLSTGFKINNAEDDAAGFAIATKLKSRVAGLEQALQNVSDAKSVLGVVEGSYNSIIDNLLEMKSLATQASNGVIATGSDEMGYIASQLEALGTDINDIAISTTYNGVNLVNEAQSMTFQVGEGTTDTMAVSLTEVNMGTLFTPAGTNALAAGDVLGDNTNGGTPTAFDDDAAANNEVGNHLFMAMDANGVNAADGSDDVATLKGATILVREQPTVTGTTNGTIKIDTLFIDENTVNAADMRSFLGHIDTAITSMNTKMNQVGIDQRSLTGKEVNLTEAITANSAARSRIMDTDFAKEQSNSIRLQILQQTATAALSQANMGPQAVLGFLG